MARTGPKPRYPKTGAQNPPPPPNPPSAPPNTPQNAGGPSVQQVLQNAQDAQDGDYGGVVPQSLDALTKMSDAQLAQVLRASKNIDMPNHLKDYDDPTQKFVFAIGLNEKPQVLQGTAFDQYLKDNNIPRSQILSRSVNGGTVNVNGTTFSLTPQQVIQSTLYGKFNYIGGKRGGQAYGAGTYFDMNGGGNTGYGGSTMNAVLSPNARVISYSTLMNKIPAWRQSHPQAARLIGATYNSESIYALCMGYNVIKGHGGYHNVIDRSAIVAKG